MEWAGLNEMDGKPSNITIPHANTTKATKKHFMESAIGNFVDEFILPDLDAEKAMKLQTEILREKTATGEILQVFFTVYIHPILGRAVVQPLHSLLLNTIPTLNHNV